MERDFLAGSEMIPTWIVEWEEPRVMDKTKHVSMAPRVSLIMLYGG